MQCYWHALAAEMIASLSQLEREVSIVYMEQRIVPAGEEVSWAGMRFVSDEPVAIAFVDLEPHSIGRTGRSISC